VRKIHQINDTVVWTCVICGQ